MLMFFFVFLGFSVQIGVYDVNRFPTASLHIPRKGKGTVHPITGHEVSEAE
jgi:hypothetical protein